MSVNETFLTIEVSDLQRRLTEFYINAPSGRDWRDA